MFLTPPRGDSTYRCKPCWGCRRNARSARKCLPKAGEEIHSPLSARIDTEGTLGGVVTHIDREGFFKPWKILRPLSRHSSGLIPPLSQEARICAQVFHHNFRHIRQIICTQVFGGHRCHVLFPSPGFLNILQMLENNKNRVKMTELFLLKMG